MEMSSKKHTNLASEKETTLGGNKNRKKRVIVYIDGFNLYNGICDKHWKKFLWLNLVDFSKTFLRADEELVETKYFTTRISHPLDRKARQSRFIDALETLPDLKIFYGKYQKDTMACNRPNCGAIIHFYNEKQTDVNIASEMLVDGFNNRYDTAILVSGDSDLCAPIAHVRNLPSPKFVIVAFPPERESYELRRVASTVHQITKRQFRDSLFPEEVKSKTGFILKKPDEWK